MWKLRIDMHCRVHAADLIQVEETIYDSSGLFLHCKIVEHINHPGSTTGSHLPATSPQEDGENHWLETFHRSQWEDCANMTSQHKILEAVFAFPLTPRNRGMNNAITARFSRNGSNFLFARVTHAASPPGDVGSDRAEYQIESRRIHQNKNLTPAIPPKSLSPCAEGTPHHKHTYSITFQHQRLYLQPFEYSLS